MSEAKSDAIKYGLAGVVVDTTAISKVVPETNSLTYRGYPVQDLATKERFEDVAFLLWNGELPTAEQRAAFVAQERSLRPIDDDLLNLMQRFNPQAHPMDTLRTAVSFIGQAELTADSTLGNVGREVNMARSIDLLAKIPTIIAADYRTRHGHAPIPPDETLGFAENFFYMCLGEVPAKLVVKCFDMSMTLYAEHSFNASTFAGRVITSTESDLYSATTGAIAALKGPLHGGANEAVMHMLKEIPGPDEAAEWLQNKLAAGEKVVGFGHRVYRGGDSRVPTMTNAFASMVDHYTKKNQQAMGSETSTQHPSPQQPSPQQLWDISRALEDAMVDAKGIYPNLDFPTGPTYFLMGFDIPLFTPMFVMSRIVGWTAHFMEQAENNKLIRPLSHYVGPKQRAIE